VGEGWVIGEEVAVAVLEKGEDCEQEGRKRWW